MIRPKKASIFTSSASLIRPIGLCLSGLGLIGVTAAHAQTNGVEASRLLNAESLSSVQAPSPKAIEMPKSAIAPPEVMEVPEATAIIPVETPVNQAPESIVFSDRSAGCDTVMAWGKTVNPLCQGVPQSPKAPIAISRPEAIEQPVVETIAPEPEESSPEAESIQLGPVSVGRSGIQFSAPAALKPYFNGSLKLAKMPNFGDLKLMFPLAIPSPITSLFGWRVHPISGEQRIHAGTDIAAPLGTPVIAAMTGRVLLADFLGGYGIAVAIEHAQGTQQTLYAHLSELFVKPGEQVKQGTVIGRVGSTGNSTGPHLHFELRQQLPDGSWVAQDAGQSLEVAMGGLVNALKVEQKPSVVAQGLTQGLTQESAIDKTKSLKPQPLKVRSTTVQSPTVLKMQPSANNGIK